jgi:superfamily II DNA/RNA helicase
VKLQQAHAPGKIRQRFYEVREDNRLHAVSLLLNHYRPVSTLAFCNTKQRCRELVQVLRGMGLSALELHGDLEQRDRDQVLVQFAGQSISVLVATDIAARGLDIAGLDAVVNVDITPDADTHTHRIGRTARADTSGWAFSLASMDEMGRVGQIEQALGFSSEWHALDELNDTGSEPLRPPMRTLQILGGRKEKIRPGDVLGALTKDLGYPGTAIGQIKVNEFSTYVAVHPDIAARGLDIAQLEAVINVDITPDAATHTHRIGRTARVDASGWAFSLASMDEMGRVGQIEQGLSFSSEWHALAELTDTGTEPLRPPMRTLQILGGRKEKIRPGDVLGALTKDLGYAGAMIGKINVNEFSTYVAVKRDIAAQVLQRLSHAKVKGRTVKLRLLPG